MSYYTIYNISYNITKIHEDLCKKFALALCAINSDFVYYDGCTIEDLIESESMKWYSHEEDMIELSKLFPNVVFTLEGWGEDRDDIWREYFYNGKCQYAPAEIVFPEFDLIYFI